MGSVLKSLQVMFYVIAIFYLTNEIRDNIKAKRASRHFAEIMIRDAESMIEKQKNKDDKKDD